MFTVNFTENGMGIKNSAGEQIIEINEDGEINFLKQEIIFGIDGSISPKFGRMDTNGNWIFANAKINADGSAEFLGNMFRINADGSGQMANGNITWDANGNFKCASLDTNPAS